MEHAMDIVTIGNAMKFGQNPVLESWLFGIKETHKYMVEASPYDRVWGIGLREDNPYAQNEETWNGENRLGKCIDKAYEFLDGERDPFTGENNPEYSDMYHRVAKLFK